MERKNVQEEQTDPGTRIVMTEQTGIIIGLANQKGGVTKTTTTVNLATILALLGFKVLVVDCDPQGHSTFTFGYNGSTLTRTLYSVLLGHSSLKEVVLPTYYHPQTNMFFDPQSKINPSDPTSPALIEDLTARQLAPKRGPALVPINNQASRAEGELRQKISGATALKRALQPARQVYEYIFCDSNPSLGMLTVNMICASDYLLVPLIPEQLAVLGLRDLLSSIEEAKLEANPTLQVAGAVFTNVKNIRSHREMIADLREALPFKSFHTEIKDSSAFLDAADRRSVIVLKESFGEHAWAYWNLLAELLEVVGGKAKDKVAEALPLLAQQRQKIEQDRLERRELKATP